MTIEHFSFIKPEDNRRWDFDAPVSMWMLYLDDLDCFTSKI